MPGVGVGGLISNLVNPGLDDQIGAAVTPQSELRWLQQGQLGCGGVTSGSPNMPNAAATKQDPISANLASLLLKRQRQAELAADFNQNIQGVAAGFGTAQQQASKQAALRGGGAGGGIGDVSDIMGIQKAVTDQNEHARFMANAGVFAQTLRDHGINVTDSQATELMNTPKFMDSISTAFGSNVTQTGTVKDADAATAAWAAANPKATPQQIADYKSNLIAGGMGGNDLETRQYLQEKNAGLTTDDIATWKAKKAAQAAAMTTQAKDAQDFKDTATQDYTSVHSKLTDIQQYVDTLNKDPAAAKQALSTFLPTTGKWGALMPGAIVPLNVKDAAVALQKVQAALTAEGLSNVKNVRNIREFTTLGQAATAGLNPAASDEDFKNALATLKNRYLDTQATAELSVGHKLTGELVGHGNHAIFLIRKARTTMAWKRGSEAVID